MNRKEKEKNKENEKDTGKRMERSNRLKVFANYISNKGLLCRLCIESFK
jgi:hypothetical protein